MVFSDEIACRLLADSYVAPLAHVQMKMIAVGRIRFGAEDCPKDLARITMDRLEEALGLGTAELAGGHRALGFLVLRVDQFYGRCKERLEEGVGRNFP